MNNAITTAYTHSGLFHADDVFASALLSLTFPGIKIIRTFSVPNDAEIAFDIGFGKFDHHQADAEIRPNGIKYAAFGLLWREYGKLFLADVENFDKRFVEALDNSDNTGCGHAVANLVSAFNPSWDATTSSDEAFANAVEFAKGILIREFERIRSTEKAEDIVREALSRNDEGIVDLDKFVPWQGILVPDARAKFVIFQSQRGGWNAQQIPTTIGGIDAKAYFPDRWKATSESFKAETNGTFCHASGFLCAFDTRDEAIRACKAALAE